VIKRKPPKLSASGIAKQIEKAMLELSSPTPARDNGFSGGDNRSKTRALSRYRSEYRNPGSPRKFVALERRYLK
jgi:hypothetical protein